MSQLIEIKRPPASLNDILREVRAARLGASQVIKTLDDMIEVAHHTDAKLALTRVRRLLNKAVVGNITNTITAINSYKEPHDVLGM